MRLRLLAGSAGLTALVVLAGCAPGATPTEPAYDSRIKVDTPALRQAKAEAGIEPCAGSSGETRSDLPQVTLPCLGGGKDVDLASVEGPAVVSVWAQWCTPCRKELPLYQRLADSGAVSVLGVDFKETSPTGAIGLLDATGAVFPQVIDIDGELGEHYRLSGLPGILLVDEDGKVTFLKQSVSSYRQLTTLVRDHTGVDVTAG